MDIQWYPGHMAKARRLMAESLPLIDIVIELLDARIPLSSKNPEIDILAKNKQRIVVLNKSDMSDNKMNQLWAEFFKSQGKGVILANSINGAGVNQVYGCAKLLMKDKMERLAKKGRINAPIRAMVVGIPNVGKSTFINKIVGKKSAATGNKPGVTKANQWLKVKTGFELLDTPGILWPKLGHQRTSVNLALTGAIKDTLLDKGELCCALLDILKERYPTAILNRYGVNTDSLCNEEILGLIGEKRGHIKSKGAHNWDRTYEMLIDEFRKCKLGSLTLESPGDELMREADMPG